MQMNKKVESYQLVEFMLLLKKINIIKLWMEQKFGDSEVI